MTASFTPQAISAATFTGIRTRLSAGFGLFIDGSYRYAVMDRAFFELHVVRRVGSQTFTAAMQAVPSYRVVINGCYFSGTGLYLRAQTGAVNATSVQTIGDVYEAGSVVETNSSKDVADYFYFGRNGSSPATYLSGQGNTPSSVYEGMGGLGPLILANPGSGKPLRYGNGNVYASDPNKHSIPATPAEWSDCTQRNNNTYVSMEQHPTVGFCVIGVSDQENVIVAVIKPHDEYGDLDSLRDKLWDASVIEACFTDGSTSACFSVDGSWAFPPASFKDNLIEYGFGFLDKTVVDTKVTVTVKSVHVLNRASFWGPGSWTIQAAVNGATIGSFVNRSVNAGDVIPLGWTITTVVHGSSGQALQVTVSGKDSSWMTDDLGAAGSTFTGRSTPAWGIGDHTVTSAAGYYEVTFSIALAP